MSFCYKIAILYAASNNYHDGMLIILPVEDAIIVIPCENKETR